MSLMRLLSLINAYALWLYAAGVLVMLFGWREIRKARKTSSETIFSLEREFAGVRQQRAGVVLVVVLMLLALLTYLRFSVIPDQPLPPPQRATPTKFIIEAPTSIAATPTPTVTRIPTRPRPTREPPTETPTPTVALPPCPNPFVCIMHPTASQIISGTVTIQGTANIEAFQFYKIEYGLGENPEQWHSISNVRQTPVVDDVLDTWNTTGFPNGVVKLRLTVVDTTGNYPPPHEIRVVIQQ